ncbi:hypothetical protein TUN199_09356 [Pyrenophora tritici-repentis]|uniref:Uncharacterized protein n=1 Tax=Pyrenophora tritici-repentis TaxID=45151 RepID=A0A5M9LQB6_9PLEO|nr:hypothetical protein PtrV1_00931 [Pyrenophora tritici-repentis]KAF7453653.1 hypothetical protein A1F99_009110 [Pyrenophora tritici-repentis]KAF7576735.1 hypothetical protein PtrM4_009750 [Pyrenophora tritici-repentis]KAI0574299.1 hypothetical protein Alg215_08656 [Pyrenophora tritici-repentis]KAI0575370.1 hypothetical protein Alg130_09299 [Pyrenophora tritici-repentis]
MAATTITTSLSECLTRSIASFFACFLFPLFHTKMRRLPPEVLDEALVERDRRDNFTPEGEGVNGSFSSCRSGSPGYFCGNSTKAEGYIGNRERSDEPVRGRSSTVRRCTGARKGREYGNENGDPAC